MVHCGSQFNCTVHHGGTSLLQESQVAGHLASKVRKQRGILVFGSHSPLYSGKDPSPQRVPPTFRMGVPPQLKLSGSTFKDTPGGMIPCWFLKLTITLNILYLVEQCTLLSCWSHKPRQHSRMFYLLIFTEWRSLGHAPSKYEALVCCWLCTRHMRMKKQEEAFPGLTHSALERIFLKELSFNNPHPQHAHSHNFTAQGIHLIKVVWFEWELPS